MKENFIRQTCPECGYKRDKKIECCPKCALDKSALYNAKNPVLNIDWLKCLLVVIVGFGCQTILSSIIVISTLVVQGVDITVALNPANIDPFYTSLAFNIATTCAIVGIFIVLRRYFRPLMVSIKHYKNLLFGLIIAVLVVGFNFLYEDVIFAGYVNNENTSLLMEQLKSSPVLFICGTVILAPLYEELLFRVAGFSFFSKINKPLAYILTTLLFAIFHLNFGAANITAELISLPSYLVVGAGLAFAYDKFGFWGSTLVHLLNNLTAGIIAIVTLL